MRTKNAKRLWPVPATLGIIALATLLAFGLMATNGAHPAAAQDSADCTITINAMLVGTPGLATGALSIADIDADDQLEDATATDLDCSAMGDSATIKLVGPAGNPGDEDPIDVYLLIEDKSGDLSFYPDGTVWQKEDGTGVNTREKGIFYASNLLNAGEVKPTRYSEMNVSVPRAMRTGGRFSSQSTTVTVESAAKVHVYLPADYAGNLVEDLDADDCSPGACNDQDNPPTSVAKATRFGGGQPGTNATNGDSSTINITYLGPPAIGKDSDNDRNKIIDDFQQCAAGLDGELSDDSSDADGDDAHCTPDAAEDDARDGADKGEIRSKLIAFTTGRDPTTLINGKSMDHELSDTDSMATVYVVLKDADGDDLEDTDVDFSVTSEPSQVFSSARTVGTDAAATDLPAVGIDEGDAIASRVIDNLPTDHGYRVIVEVSSGGVDLGTIVITRHGTPTTLKAATFNGACLEDVGKRSDGDPDYGPAMVDLEKKDCAMQTRFGAGDVIVVKSHLEDSLGTVTAGDIEVDLADDFDDPLDADGEDDLDQAVAANVNPVAFVYVVDEDAQLGVHMITVSTDEDDVDDVTLTVQVAGPPHSYSISGGVYIPLNGSAEFTVTAMDEKMGIPAFDTSVGAEADEDNMVSVFIQGLPAGNARGLMNGMVKLDEDTGVGTFNVYAPPDATQGHTIRIFVGTGDMEVMHTAMFGTAPPMEPGMPTAPSVAMAAVSGNSVTVTWMDGQNVGGHGVVLFTSDFSSWPYIDMGMGETHTFDNVSSGSYIAVVVALDAQGALMTNAQGGYIYTASTVITVP